MTDPLPGPSYDRPRKNVVLALLLAFFLGPVGLLYTSVRAALLILALPVICTAVLLLGVLAGLPALSVISITFLVIYALCGWLICIVLALVLSQRYNEEQERQEYMHLQERRLEEEYRRPHLR